MKDTTKTLIETTNFNNCTNTKGKGGSLYFSTEGECVQNRICSLNSNSALRGMYCWVDVSNIAKHKNKILNSSISQSGNLYKDKESNIVLINGEIEINSINISFADIYSNSLFGASSYSSSSRALFSTFSNNTDHEPLNSYLDYFSDSSETFLIKSCNYLSNNLHVIVSSWNAYVNVVNCNFINNTVRNEYFRQNSDDFGSIIIDGCYFDERNLKTDGQVNIKNNEANPIKIEFPKLSCEFDIPKSKNEVGNKTIYFKRKKKFFKNLHFMFFQSFFIIS